MKNQTRWLLLALLSLCSCSHFSMVQEEQAADGTSRRTRTTAYTFFDSKSELSKSRATTTDKSQIQSIGSLSQESSDTNIIALGRELGAGVAEGVVKGLKK